MWTASQKTRWKSFAATAAFLAVTGIVEYIVYFHDLHHFFQGDSIFLLYHRPLSIAEFLRGFLTIDVSGRYRPLGNWLAPSLLFPWFGLNPEGYRICTFIIFFAVTIAVFALVSQLTESRVAAITGTFFFATHTVNAYSTYDVAFITELMWSLFYICSVISYVRYIQTNRRFFMAISLLCFAGSLLSKETAVTLPATLVAVDLFMNRSGSPTNKILAAAAKVRWHAIMLAIYVAFGFGYLQVYGRNIQTQAPAQPQPGYHFILNPKVMLVNVDQAMTWAFNIPRGWHAQWRDVPQWSLTFLKDFRVSIAILALIVLFNRRRRWLFVGLAWFLIAIGPALPLRDHFIPYYLFLPLVGFALVIGACVDLLYQYLNRHTSPLLAALVCLPPFIVLAFVCAVSSRSDADSNPLLGGSAQLALNSINDMKSQFPEIKPNTTVYIIDTEDAALSWIQAQGGLFKLYYKNALKQVLYFSEESGLPSVDRASLIVLKYDNGRLHDLTVPLLANPTLFDLYTTHYVDGPYEIKLTPAEVVAGKGSYLMTIEGLADRDVAIHYVLNEAPVKSFITHLNSQGQSLFDVASNTPKGLYQFIGFSLPGAGQAWRSDAQMTIR